MERTDLDWYQLAVIKILIQGGQNRMMNPTHDAFHVDGKEGDTMDSPEEISFPYKLYQARHKTDYQDKISHNSK